MSASLVQMESSVKRMDFTAVSLRDDSRFDEQANAVALFGRAPVNNHCGNLIDRNGYPGKVETNQATAQFLSHRAVTAVAKAR